MKIKSFMICLLIVGRGLIVSSAASEGSNGLEELLRGARRASILESMGSASASSAAPYMPTPIQHIPGFELAPLSLESLINQFGGLNNRGLSQLPSGHAIQIIDLNTIPPTEASVTPVADAYPISADMLQMIDAQDHQKLRLFATDVQLQMQQAELLRTQAVAELVQARMAQERTQSEVLVARAAEQRARREVIEAQRAVDIAESAQSQAQIEAQQAREVTTIGLVLAATSAALTNVIDPCERKYHLENGTTRQQANSWMIAERLGLGAVSLLACYLTNYMPPAVVSVPYFGSLGYSALSIGMDIALEPDPSIMKKHANISFILEKAGLEKRNNKGIFAINIADDVTVQKLIESGIDLEDYSWADGCKTALFQAAIDENIPVSRLQMLIDAKAHVNARDSKGNTPLMISDSVDKCKALIAAGADVNAVNGQKKTALMLTNNSKKIEALLQAHVDIHAFDWQGATALAYAVLEYNDFKFYVLRCQGLHTFNINKEKGSGWLLEKLKSRKKMLGKNRKSFFKDDLARIESVFDVKLRLWNGFDGDLYWQLCANNDRMLALVQQLVDTELTAAKKEGTSK